jgi:hypothetical protein
MAIRNIGVRRVVLLVESDWLACLFERFFEIKKKKGIRAKTMHVLKNLIRVKTSIPVTINIDPTSKPKGGFSDR